MPDHARPSGISRERLERDMKREVWTLLFALLLAALISAQSGDGAEGGDGDVDRDSETGVYCFFVLERTFDEPDTLTCVLEDDLIGANVSLRFKDNNHSYQTPRGPMRWNQNGSKFTVPIQHIIPEYELSIDGQLKMTMSMKEIIKLPTPQKVEVTYLNDSGAINISVGYNNKMVKEFLFHVHIWNTVTHGFYESPYEPFVIENERLGKLRMPSEYSIKVRVKPEGTFFSGDWSEWSPTSTFRVDKVGLNGGSEEVLVFVIITAITILLLLVIALVSQYYRKKLKAYILPTVPHPKATLIDMQNCNKGLLLNINQETFNDIHINRLDEILEDKSLVCDSLSGKESGSSDTSSCSSPLDLFPPWQPLMGAAFPLESQATLQGGQEQVDGSEGHCRWDPLGSSGSGSVELGSLVETDSSSFGDSQASSPSTEGPQHRECKDEAYVTMSSLFRRTQ